MSDLNEQYEDIQKAWEDFRDSPVLQEMIEGVLEYPDRELLTAALRYAYGSGGKRGAEGIIAKVEGMVAELEARKNGRG